MEAQSDRGQWPASASRAATLPPNAAASAMHRVPVPGRGVPVEEEGMPANWGNAIPETRAEALEILGMGVTPDANDAAIKKIVDGLRLSWHPDLARDEADRQLRELRLKQINVAWEIIQGRRGQMYVHPSSRPPAMARKRNRWASRDLPRRLLQIPDSLAVLGFRDDGWRYRRLYSAASALALERQAQLRPQRRERRNQPVHVGVGMLGLGRDAQALGAARHGRVVDRLHVDGEALEQRVGDALGQHRIADQQRHDVARVVHHRQPGGRQPRASARARAPGGARARRRSP